jgi:hypothetical protein
MKYHSSNGVVQVNHSMEFRYTPGQRNRVNTAVDLLDSAFNAESIQVNYRKGFVRILMLDPSPKNAVLAAKVKHQFSQAGYTLTTEPNRVTINLPRAVLEAA